jgi:hypothetical protein
VIAVVHLVWGPLGPAPLRDFVASYHRHPAGADHELVVLFNGLDDGARPVLEAELCSLEHRPLALAAPLQDLAAYAEAARRLPHERLCFLNSYSVLLADGWLAKLDAGLSEPGAGLVGATGSWASVRSGALNGLFLPNAYRGLLPARRVAREQFRAIEVERGARSSGVGSSRRHSALQMAGAALRALAPMPEQILRFDGFPAAHVRTNAFMVERAKFACLRIGRVRRKMDAYVLESGHHSLTRQTLARGLRPLVIASNGAAFERDEWPRSRTLWQGDQEGLIVADNQTRMYARGGIDRRRLLSAFAWGLLADPSPPAAEQAS